MKKAISLSSFHRIKPLYMEDMSSDWKTIALIKTGCKNIIELKKLKTLFKILIPHFNLHFYKVI